MHSEDSAIHRQNLYATVIENISNNFIIYYTNILLYQSVIYNNRIIRE